MKLIHLLAVLGAIGLCAVAVPGVLPPSRITAAGDGACLSRTMEDVEFELAELHAAWRPFYVPGADPSEPLATSAPLRAAALGLARQLAAGALQPADLTSDLLASRAIECGYSPEFAVGGRGVAVGEGLTPQQALTLMTSEQWGSAAGIRVPRYVDGLEMRCIGLAHATVPGASPGEAWLIIIMAGAPACPTSVANIEPYDGGTPAATATPPFARPSATPSPTPSPASKPASNGGRVFVTIARD